MKKITLVFALCLLTTAVHAQFDNWVSNQGYNKTLEFNMNNSLNDIQAYRFSSSAGGSGLSSSLKFQTKYHSKWSTRLTFREGRVGIGSNNPDEMLTVKGTIHAEEVKVDLLVPGDYVFEKYYEGVSVLKKDYRMPTLAEIEIFTKENHHLPEIPSAKEIQENGLKLSEMTNLLLQKIEELTLYTIEQEKRIQLLEEKLTDK